MRKIDLHVHTKAIAEYDKTNNRNVTKQDFLTKLTNSNVGYVAITNHNNFDIDQYNDFISNDNDINIWPGIELDIKVNENDESYKNINLIFDPKYANELSRLTTGWNVSRKEIEGFDELISIFDKMNPMYLCDYKSNNKRRIELIDVEKLRTKTINPVIVDVNNDKTKLVLKFHDFKCLLGTDNQDWDNYESYALDLGVTIWNISNFNEMFSLLKHDNNATVTLLLDKRKKRTFEIKINNQDFSVNTYNGLNVLFGGKGTGKSKIIEQIKVKLASEGISSEYYKSSEKEKEYKELFPEVFTVTSDKKDKYVFLESLINEVKVYSENKITIANMNNFYVSLFSKSNARYLFASKPATNYLKPNHEESYKRLVNQINNLNLELKKDELLFLSDEAAKLKVIFNDVQNKLISQHFKISSDYLFSNHELKVINIVKSITLQSKGEFTLPNSIGLFNLWNSRFNLKESCKKILKYKSVEKSIVKNFESNIPEKGDINYLQIVKPFEDDDWKPVSSLSNGVKLSKILEIISNIASGKINGQKFESEVAKLIDLIAKGSLIYEHFITHLGSVYQIPKSENILECELNNFKTDLSDGEKATMVLVDKLNTNNEWLLLDEPSVYLGAKITATTLVPKIKELQAKGINVILATHDPNLAINSLPINMIYRKFISKDNYETHYGNWWGNKFVDENDFVRIVTDNFEGSLEQFEFRKEIYTNENNNNNK